MGQSGLIDLAGSNGKSCPGAFYMSADVACPSVPSYRCEVLHSKLRFRKLRPDADLV